MNPQAILKRTVTPSKEKTMDELEAEDSIKRKEIKLILEHKEWLGLGITQLTIDMIKKKRDDFVERAKKASKLNDDASASKYIFVTDVLDEVLVNINS